MMITLLALFLSVPASSAGPFRPVLPIGGAAVPGGERNLLAILGNDGDASVRVAAAMGLKPYAVFIDGVRGALMGVLRDSREKESVRRECAKSLSLVSADSAVYDALLEIGEDGALSEDLRSAALKSLYRMTNAAEVRRRVLAVMNGGAEPVNVRRAASWALFKEAGAPEVRRDLLALGNSGEDDNLRAEAVKSLFARTGDPEVERALLGFAEDVNESLLIRWASTLAFVNRRGQAPVRRRLEALRDTGGPQLRAVAINALTMPVDETVAAFFHLDAYGGGAPRDPLINE